MHYERKHVGVLEGYFQIILLFLYLLFFLLLTTEVYKCKRILKLKLKLSLHFKTKTLEILNLIKSYFKNMYSEAFLNMWFKEKLSVSSLDSSSLLSWINKNVKLKFDM